MYADDADAYSNNSPPRPTAMDIDAKPTKRVSFIGSDDTNGVEKGALPSALHGKPPLVPVFTGAPRSILRTSASGKPERTRRVSFEEEEDDDKTFSEPTLFFSHPPPLGQTAPEEVEEEEEEVTPLVKESLQPEQQQRGPSITLNGSPAASHVRDVLSPDGDVVEDSREDVIAQQFDEDDFSERLVEEAPRSKKADSFETATAAASPTPFSNVSLSPPTAERPRQDLSVDESTELSLSPAGPVINHSGRKDDGSAHNINGGVSSAEVDGEEAFPCAAPLSVEKVGHEQEVDYEVHKHREGMMEFNSPPRRIKVAGEGVEPSRHQLQQRQQDRTNSFQNVASVEKGAKRVDMHFDDRDGDYENHSTAKFSRGQVAHSSDNDYRTTDPIAAMRHKHVPVLTDGNRSKRENSARDLVIEPTESSGKDLGEMEPIVSNVKNESRRYALRMEDIDNSSRVPMHTSDSSPAARFAIPSLTQHYDVEQPHEQSSAQTSPALMPNDSTLSAGSHGTPLVVHSSVLSAASNASSVSKHLFSSTIAAGDSASIVHSPRPSSRQEEFVSFSEETMRARRGASGSRSPRKHKRRHKRRGEEAAATPRRHRRSHSNSHSHRPRDSEKSRHSEKHNSSEKHKRSERHRSSEKHKKSERHRSSEKHKRSERHRSSDEQKSSEKQRSAEKQKSSEKQRSAEKQKILEKANERRLESIRRVLMELHHADPPRRTSSHCSPPPHAPTAAKVTHSEEKSFAFGRAARPAGVRRAIFPPTRTPSPPPSGHVIEEQCVTDVPAMRTFARSIVGIARALKQSELLKML